MKELSLNILDITENSVKANAQNIKITINETDKVLEISIEDDGYGMDAEMLKNVTDPFCTTRTTRKVGMGIPLFKLAAEQTGGSFEIASKDIKNYPDEHGTKTYAKFLKNNIDFTPLGDIISTITTLIQGSPHIDFYFAHYYSDKEVSIDTKTIREILGDEVSLSDYEVIKWIESSLKDEYAQFSLR